MPLHNSRLISPGRISGFSSRPNQSVGGGFIDSNKNPISEAIRKRLSAGLSGLGGDEATDTIDCR